MAMPHGNVVISDKMQFPAGGGGVATNGGVGGSAGVGGNEMHLHQRQQWLPVDERDGFIMWLRGEFAAANAMIDSLCQHLRAVGEPGEYDFVIGSIQQRRCNWNPVLHMQQYFSVGEVMLALQEVALKKQRQQQQQHQHRYHYDQPKGSVKDFKRSSFNKGQRGSVPVGGGEVVKVAVHSSIENHNLDQNSSGNISIHKFQEVKSDDGGKKLEDKDFVVIEDKQEDANAEAVTDNHKNKPGNLVGSLCQNSEAEAESAENQSEDKTHSDHNQNERQNLNITPKTFVGIEMIDGKPVNVVDGLKLYEKLLDETKVSKLVSLVNELRAEGKRGRFQGPTYVVSKRPMKGHGREMIQFGTAVADAPVEDDNVAGLTKDRKVEPIPSELQDVIEFLVTKQVMTMKPDSCVIDIYNEGDHSQPHMYPSWYGKPVYALFLTECSLTFGKVIVADRPGDYRGSLRLGLLPGSLLLMQGKSSDFARHAISSTREHRIIVTFTKSEPRKFAASDGQRFPSPAAAPSLHWGPPPSRSPNHIRHSVPKHYAPIPSNGVLSAPSIRPQIPPPNGVPPIFVTTPVAAPVPYPAAVPLPPVSTGWPAAPPRHPQNRLPVHIPGTGVFLPPPGSGNAPSAQSPVVSSVETITLSERENGSAKPNHGIIVSSKEKTDGKTNQECNGKIDEKTVMKEEQSQQNMEHTAATESGGAV